MKHNAIIATRFSDPKQMGNTSTAVQMKSCKAYVQNSGFSLIGYRKWEAESAKGSNVARIVELLDFCKQYKGKADVLVVFKIDRFARQSEHHYYLKSELNKLGISLRSATEAIDDSPTGELLEGVLAAVAQFDNSVKRERVKLSLRNLLERGIWPWKVPLGYMNIKNGFDKADIAQIDESCAQSIKMVFSLFSSGSSTISEIARKLSKQKIVDYKGREYKFSPQLVSKILKNKFYMGLMIVKKWDNEEFEGGYQPLVDYKTFMKCQARLNPQSESVQKLVSNPDFPLRDELYCDHCEKKMTAAWCTGKSKKYPLYYCKNKKCSNKSKKSVDRAELEQEFYEFLKVIRPTQENVERIKELVIKRYQERQSEFETKSSVLRQKLEALVEEKKNLIAMVKKGADYDDIKDDLEENKAKTRHLRLELNESHEEEFKIELLLDYADNFLRNLPKFWFNSGPENKVKLQRILFPKGIVYSYPGFSNTELSPLFRLFNTSVSADETVVTPRRIELRLPG
jgi:site-specific DNA recombinase